MACYQTCVDVGSRCNYSVKRSSCTDCGKITASHYNTPKNSLCPCDSNTYKSPFSPLPTLSPACTPCREINVGASEPSKKLPATPTSPTPAQKDSVLIDKRKECDKQSFWQWLLSLLGLGKKNDDCETQGESGTVAEVFTPYRKEDTPTNQEENKNRLQLKEDSQAPKTPPAPDAVKINPSGDINNEKSKTVKHGRVARKRKRSKSVDSKSRNKYLGKPIDLPTPLKRSNQSGPQPPSKQKTSSQHSKQLEKNEKPTTKRPPISPVYSSVRYLKPYSAGNSEASLHSNPEKKSTTQANEEKQAVESKSISRHRCPPCVEILKQYRRSMSCPTPCCISPCCCPTCPVYCATNPCCNPSITALMRKRCPAPKVGRQRSKSCSYSFPRCVNECADQFKKEMKNKRKEKCCSFSPPCECTACAPVRCPPCISCPPCPPPHPCPPKRCVPACQCCPPKLVPPRCEPPCKPKLSFSACENICQKPTSIQSSFPHTTSKIGKCPVTCMRPCCVPLLNYKSSCCPSKGPTSCPKTHTVCQMPKTTSKYPPVTSMFCYPSTLKSYTKSKDNDAYCRFLMSRYNVSVPDYPPVCPLTLSGCKPWAQVSPKVPNIKFNPCEGNSGCCGNATQNYTQSSKEDGPCPCHKKQNEPVIFNSSPCKAKPFSSFRLPKRTPVECVRETGPRSPVKEYTSKLGLPNKLKIHESPPAPLEPTEEIIPPAVGSPESKPAPKGKSAKRKKAQKVKEEQSVEENAEVGDNVAQNKSDNKTYSDSGTDIRVSSPKKTGYPTGRSHTEPPKPKRITKRVATNKTSCSIKQYSTGGNKQTGSSFYRHFLGISPKANKIVRQPSEMSSQKKEITQTAQRSPINFKRTVYCRRSRSSSPSCRVPSRTLVRRSHNAKVTVVPSAIVTLQTTTKNMPLLSPKRKEDSFHPKERSAILESSKAKIFSPKKSRNCVSPKRKLGNPIELDYDNILFKLINGQESSVKDFRKPESPKPTVGVISYEHGHKKNISLLAVTDNLDQNHVETTKVVALSLPERSRSLRKESDKRPYSKSKERTRSQSLKRSRSQNIEITRVHTNEMKTGPCNINQIEGKKSVTKSPILRVNPIPSELRILRDEIIALLNDSNDHLPDLKRSPVEENGYQTASSSRTSVPSVYTSGINDETLSEQKVTKPTANTSPCYPREFVLKPAAKERDGSSSVDGEVHEIGSPAKTWTNSFNQQTNLCRESSVDPEYYGKATIVESCVDPIHFHSGDSALRCRFHGKSAVPVASLKRVSIRTLLQGEKSSDVLLTCKQNEFSKNNPNQLVYNKVAMVEHRVCLSNNISNNSIGNEMDIEINKEECNAEDIEIETNESVGTGDIHAVKESCNGEESKCNAQCQPNYPSNAEETHCEVRTVQSIKTGVILENETVFENSQGLQNGNRQVPDDPMSFKRINSPNGPKRSLLQDLLSNSGIMWQKIGPTSETDLKILRLGKAAMARVNKDTANLAELNDVKVNETAAKPYFQMLKSDKDEIDGDLSGQLLKPEDDGGAGRSILSRMKDF